MMVRRSRLASVGVLLALFGCQCPGHGPAPAVPRAVTAEEIAVLREIEQLRERDFANTGAQQEVGRASDGAVIQAHIALLEARLARIRAEAAAR